ncbi:MAG: hypothetical protein ACYC96_11000, partial [Fimbriimonadaceae bacterium]
MLQKVLACCVAGGSALLSSGQSYSAQSISSSANIFGAGNVLDPTPNPGGGTGGVAAPEFDLTAGAGRVLTFGTVSGMISMTPGVLTVPDGLQSDGSAPYGASTNITSFQGI